MSFITEVPTAPYATLPCDKDGLCPQHKQQGAQNAASAASVDLPGNGTGYLHRVADTNEDAASTTYSGVATPLRINV